MHYHDFHTSHFYFHNGQAEVEIGMVLQSPDGKYYEVHYDERPEYNEVYLREPNGTRIEPSKLFLETCYIPLDPNRIPNF